MYSNQYYFLAILQYELHSVFRKIRNTFAYENVNVKLIINLKHFFDLFFKREQYK